jgi:DNA (cytosine-5)-methyltransferase 1
MSTGRQSVAVVHGAEIPITSEDCGHPCTCNHNGLENCVAIAENVIGRKVENGGNGVGAQEELAYTQNASGVMGVCNSTVRRLTPIECERLMGFPDNHTRIEWNGKPEEECPDAPRYKACGNSMCVNVMRWIGMQIDRVDKMESKNERKIEQ